jgi:cysteine desulfurase
MNTIYLDHAAATPMRPEVRAAMEEAASTAFANPSSQHAAGRTAKRLLEDARERIVELVGGRAGGATRDRLVFTSGATEANRMAMLGLARGGCLIAVSPRDHGSVISAETELSRRGHAVRTLPLTPEGAVARDALASLMQAAGGTTVLLTTTPVCSQTGLLDFLALDVASDAATNGVIALHADSTQAAAWYPLNFADSLLTTMTLAPHKFGGPRGIGGLVIRAGTALDPLLPGPQELGLRGGTEAVTLAVGFARALELAAIERDEVAPRVTSLRDQFEAQLIAAAIDAGLEAIVIGQRGSRAPHITAVAIVGMDRQSLVMAADLEGVCLSTGTACSSGSSEPPVVLAAIGVPNTLTAGTIRASFGRTTTPVDIDDAIRRLRRVFVRLGRSLSVECR